MPYIIAGVIILIIIMVIPWAKLFAALFSGLIYLVILVAAGAAIVFICKLLFNFFQRRFIKAQYNKLLADVEAEKAPFFPVEKWSKATEDTILRHDEPPFYLDGQHKAYFERLQHGVSDSVAIGDFLEKLTSRSEKLANDPESWSDDDSYYFMEASEKLSRLTKKAETTWSKLPEVLNDPDTGNRVLLERFKKWSKSVTTELEKHLEAIHSAIEEKNSQGKKSRDADTKKAEALKSKADQEKRANDIREREQKLKQQELEQDKKKLALEEQEKATRAKEAAAKKARAEKEKAALKALERADQIPLEDFVKYYRAKLDQMGLNESHGDNHTGLLELHESLVGFFKKNNLISPERLEDISPDVRRINQIEAIIDLYGEKIKRVKHDETLDDDEERETKVEYWMRLRDRDIQALEE